MRGAIMGVMMALAAICPATALADLQLGDTSLPSGSTQVVGCQSEVVYQPTGDPSTPYVVPSPGGYVKAWQVNTTDATVEGQVSLVALRAQPAERYEVLGVDTERLPFTLPADHIVSFTVPSKNRIQVRAGDVFGLTSSAIICLSSGGSIPLSDSVGLQSLPNSQPPTKGQVLNPESPPSQGSTLNLGVTLAQDQDVSVTASSIPADPTVGNLAELLAEVSNHGPASEPIVFTDSIPAHLQVRSAVAGSGACRISGQHVACTISGLPPRGRAPVAVTVVPTRSGRYVNKVEVVSTAGEPDPTPADNRASATLSVSRG